RLQGQVEVPTPVGNVRSPRDNSPLANGVIPNWHRPWGVRAPTPGHASRPVPPEYFHVMHNRPTPRLHRHAPTGLRDESSLENGPQLAQDLLQPNTPIPTH